MPTGILALKIGAPIEMPTKRLLSLLEQSRLACCQAKNAAITHWLLWRRAHHAWKPGDEYEAPPLKINRKSKPADPSKSPPKDPPFAPRQFLSRELYRVAVAAAPKLAANLASSCVQEVVARLKANTPYDHEGAARWVWQAVLASEVSLPTWRGGTIPAPRANMVLTYDDHQCTLRFALLSKASGYTTLSPTVRLDAGDLSAGNRRLLRKLADGTIRLADSTICERKGKWFVNLVYSLPATGSGLSVDRVLTLLPSLPDDRWPFCLTWQDGEDQRRWLIGNGKPLVAEYRRVQARRRALRFRYRDGAGSGHGKGRFFRALRPISRAVQDMQSRFEKQTASDIVKMALREECGAVVYREPTMPVREKCWFASQDMPFNWTSFLGRLKFRAEKAGLQFSVTRIGMGEWNPKEKAAS
jgi:hypothetical protein